MNNNIYILTLVLLCLCSTAQAQRIIFFGVDSTMNNYRKSVQTTTGFEYSTSEETDRNITLAFLNTETSYYVLNRLSVGGDLFLMLPRGERIVDGQTFEVNAFGGGFAGSLRWEFVQLINHTLFFENSIGMVFTTKPFPPQGTAYNFIIKRGMGANVKLSNTTQMTFGYRWTHVSNGTGLVPTNPSYNGNGIYIGFNFQIPKE